MSLINRIEAYLINQNSDFLDRKDEVLMKKARFTLWLNASVAIMVTIVYFASIRRSGVGGYSGNLISILPGALLLPTLLMKLGAKFYFIPLSISIITCSWISTLRILVTGGFYSPNCFLILTIIYVAATMLTKNFLYLLVAYWSVFLGYLAFAHNNGLIGNPAKNLINASTISLILFLILIQILTRFYSSIEKKFEAKIRQLEKRSATSELVAAMAHEINTPIFVAEMATEVLKQDRAADKPKREKFLGKIQSSHQKILTILDNLNQILNDKRTNLAVKSFDGSKMIDLSTNSQSINLDSEE